MLELLQKVDSLPPALKCFTLASIQNAQQRLQIRFDEDAQVIFDEKIAEYEDNQGMANWLQFIQMEAFGPLGILPSLLSSSNYFEDKLVALMLELAIKSSQKWWVKTVQQQQIIKKEAQARQGEVSDGMQKLNNAATNKDDKAMGNLAKSLDKLPGVNKDFIKDALHRAIRRCPQSMDAALEPLILWLKKEKGCDIDLSKVLPPRVEEVDPRLDALASSDNIYEKMAGEVIKLCSDDSMNVEQKMDRLQYLRSLQGVVDNKEKNAVNLDKLSRRKEKISAQVSSAQQSMQETVSLLNNIIKLTHEMALQSSRLG